MINLRNTFIFSVLFIFFATTGITAKELCDCYGTCIEIQPREVSTALKRKVKIKDGYSPYAKLEIDHKIPLCLGGSNDISNLQSLTPKEHDAKTEHDMLLLYFVNNCLMTIDEAQTEAKSWKKQK